MNDREKLAAKKEVLEFIWQAAKEGWARAQGRWRSV